MCQSVFVVGEDQKALGTARELATWLGCSPDELLTLDDEPMQEGEAHDWRDSCLCPFDVPATLDNFRIWHRRDVDGDSMCYLAMKLTH